MIHDLLSESPVSARARGRQLWDTHWNPGTPLILHGAGNIGVRTLRHLQARGIEPLAFADLSPEKQGRRLGGLPVLAPAEAAAHWGSEALFLVTIINRAHSYAATSAAYARLGARTAPVLAYFWAHPEDLLPYYAMSTPETVLEAREGILAAYEALDDQASREYLQKYLRWRLHLDFDTLPGPCGAQEFFPAGLVSLKGSQGLVDCGAYDGDTLRQFLSHSEDGIQEAHLFEPDPANFKALSLAMGELSPEVARRVSLYPMAVGARPGRLRFQGDGNEASALSDVGNLEVPVVALDEVLRNARPTFVKMDIEGAELEALAGAEHLIQAHRPTLAISVYHRPNHPWKVLLAMKRLLPDHRLALRPHGEDGWEWVAYAVPF